MPGVIGSRELVHGGTGRHAAAGPPSMPDGGRLHSFRSFGCQTAPSNSAQGSLPRQSKILGARARVRLVAQHIFTDGSGPAPGTCYRYREGRGTLVRVPTPRLGRIGASTGTRASALPLGRSITPRPVQPASRADRGGGRAASALRPTRYPIAQSRAAAAPSAVRLRRRRSPSGRRCA